MSFGRPVEPPDVGAFHAGEVASGSGSSEYSADGSYPFPKHCTPSGSNAAMSLPGSTPTTTFGEASSTMAASSRGGSFADTG